MSNDLRMCCWFLCTAFTTLVTLAFAGHTRAEEPEPTLDVLDNSDVEWLTSLYGVGPRISTRAQAVLRGLEGKDVEKLVQWTKDEKKFVIAHVLLSRIYPVDKKVRADSYFGLAVDVYSDGTIKYPKYKPEKLAEYWNQVRKDHKPTFEK